MTCTALVKVGTVSIVHCPEHEQEEPHGYTVECRNRHKCNNCADKDSLNRPCTGCGVCHNVGSVKDG